MKKFYLKQKVFSFKDRFKIFDDNQNVAFYCKGKFFSISRKKDFFKADGDVLLFTLKRKVFSFLPKYFILNAQGETIATVKKHFTFMKAKLSIESTIGNFTIQGDVWAHNFTIAMNNESVVTVQKKWISWGDTYEISVFDDRSTALYLAMVIVIDDCLHSNRQRGGLTVGR